METKKPKVTFLSFYSGEIYRGVETYVYQLANKLVELGNDVTVFQNGPVISKPKYKVISTAIKIKWDKKSTKFTRTFYIDYWSILIKKFTSIVLKKIDKDTDIVISTNGGWQTRLCKLWCMVNGKKLIVPGQSGLGADDKWNLLCFPNVFIALTNPQKKWADKFNPFVKKVIIPNGVDLKKFNQKNKPIKIDLPKPIILSAAALTPGKRLNLLIKATSKTKASLLLVGKGELEKELLELGNKLMPGRLKIISLPFSEMPKIYTACDLFSFSTNPWESFGIVMLEAMACGLPVVASDDPIRHEIVGDAGLFVDPTNTGQYTKTLEQALNTKWGTKPQKQAEKFNWDNIALKYKELFNKLLK